ncbi:response regulator transcription factor [Pedobacter changchengzhani]|uniref:Response regulator transcription factor n=1 Tax=Pedobacter changchengzhani TaxID=2529274 RepID=A0A4R5MP13_9SPHI|nr:response regulator transcription factor [Pedobacter changchengzhani]TDG37547.1 response regulator transcription factor [Pedobacter changchengzhani]
MFKKVLIVEDHESVSISVQKSLTDLGIPYDSRDYVYYCDDAIKRIEKAIAENEPYELLITDLSFEEDTPQLLKTGVDLIKAVKEIQPKMKTLVFSIENRAHVAQLLLKELDIDAFIPKARHDAKDLKLAIEALANGKKYFSNNLKQTVKDETPFKFTDYDTVLLKLLANGTAQKDIPIYFKKHNVVPAGLSSIEKRLSQIKTTLNLSSNEHLIAYVKDRKVI